MTVATEPWQKKLLCCAMHVILIDGGGPNLLDKDVSRCVRLAVGHLLPMDLSNVTCSAWKSLASLA